MKNITCILSIVILFVLACTSQCYARGCGPCGPGGRGPGGWHRPCGPGGWGPGHNPGWHHPPPHHGGWYGPSGRNFWPGFVGGVVGGMVANGCRPYYGGGYYGGGYYPVATPVVAAPAPIVVAPTSVYSTPVVSAPVVQSYPVTTYPVAQTVVQPTYQSYQSTTIVNPASASTPLVGAGVNIGGLRVGVGVGY